MQRRRLGELARIVFHVLGHCAGARQREPVVFSSVMGEIQRTQGILDSMAAGVPVSPSAFSLSVHNSIGGLWSLINENRAPMIALSPTVGSPVAALVEAAGILAEQEYSAVNVVFYEEVYPQFYAPFLNGPGAPFALALRLLAPESKTDPEALLLELEPISESVAVPLWENNLSLTGLLRGEQSSVLIAEPQSTWRLGTVV